MAATAVHFDTLGAAEDLEAAGIPHNQAKAISLIVDRSRDSGKLATEMATMRTDIAVLKANVRHIFWISGIQTAVLVAILLKLF